MHRTLISPRMGYAIGTVLVVGTAATGIGADQAVTPSIEIHATSDPRDPTATLAHLLTGACPASPGTWLTDQETVLSANGARSVQDGIEAVDAILNLPEGSSLKAVFTSDRMITERLPDRTRLTLYGGQVRVVDVNGVVRVSVRAGQPRDQNALLRLDASFEAGEVVLRVQAFASDGLYVPLKIKLDTDGGPSQAGEQPYHGAVRWKTLPPDESGKPLRLKMQFVYDIHELCRESENEGWSTDRP